MFRGWKGYYNKEPEVEGSIDYYKIIFSFKSGGLKGGLNEGLNEGLSEGLSEGLKTLFSFIKNNPSVKSKIASEKLKRPIKTIERQIKELKNLNLIERRGSRKTGGYWAK